MKRILVTLLTAVGITGPFVMPLAAEPHTAQADVPFAFVVSNVTLPAGQYRISEVKAGSPVFAVRDEWGHSTFVQLSSTSQGKPENPSLTFACYGKECVLAKVALSDSETAYSLSPSAIEKKLPRSLGMASMISVKLGAR